MFGFEKNSPDSVCGAVLDIASARVDLAIVVADPEAGVPLVVWSHTERVLAGEQVDLETLSKKIITAAANAFLVLGSQGLKALHAYDARARLAVCDVYIGAPWSHTITKRLSYKKEKSFTITESLLDEIMHQAETDMLTQETQSSLLKTLELRVLSQQTNGYELNGYVVHDPIDKSVQDLVIHQTFGVAHAPLITGIATSHETVVPSTTLSSQTKIAAYMHTYVTSAPYGLLLISGESTELAVVQDECLLVCTHESWGHNMLARHIMQVTHVPYVDALSLLTQPLTTIKEQLALLRPDLYDEILTMAKDHLLRTLERLQITDQRPTTILIEAEGKLTPLFVHILQKMTRSKSIPATAILSTAAAFTAQQANETPIENVLAYVFHTTHIEK